MSVRSRRVVVAGIAAAAAVALPAAALASGSGSPSAKPSPAATKSAATSEPRVAPSTAAAKKSAAAARKSAAAGSGTSVDRSLTGAVAVAALANQLGVSRGAARHALQQIIALNRQGGVNPTGPAFAAIAHDLGVSPAQLAAALGAVKRSAAGR
jgi:hypothetical protein